MIKKKRRDEYDDEVREKDSSGRGREREKNQIKFYLDEVSEEGKKERERDGLDFLPAYLTVQLMTKKEQKER